MPGEVCQCLAQTPRKKGRPFPPAVGQKSGSQQLHRGSGTGASSSRRVCGLRPSSGLSCTLPGAVGLRGEAPRLLLMGLLGSFQHCCVCGETGATIMCCKEDCDRWFHLPCAKEGHCVTQYITPYRYLLSPSGHPCGRTQHFSLCPSLFPQLLLP